MRDSGEGSHLAPHPSRDQQGPLSESERCVLEGPGSAELIGSLLGKAQRESSRPPRAEEGGIREQGVQGARGTRDSFIVWPQPDPVRKLFSCSKDSLFIWEKKVYCLFFNR